MGVGEEVATRESSESLRLREGVSDDNEGAAELCEELVES